MDFSFNDFGGSESPFQDEAPFYQPHFNFGAKFESANAQALPLSYTNESASCLQAVDPASYPPDNFDWHNLINFEGHGLGAFAGASDL